MFVRLVFFAVTFLAMQGVAQAGQVSPRAFAELQRIYRKESDIVVTVATRFRNAIVPSAKELLDPEGYAAYQKALWGGEWGEAETIVTAALMRKMPQLAKLFPTQTRFSEDQLWELGVSEQFFELSDAGLVWTLAESVTEAEEAGVLAEVFMPFDPDDESVPLDIKLHQIYLARLERSATKEASEVGMIGLARYLLDRHAGYPDALFAYIKEFPLYLLERSQIVAARRGNPGNRPPDFEALVEKARKAAGPDGVKRVEDKVADTLPRRFYRPLFRERLRAEGRPLSDIERLPPVFKAFPVGDEDSVSVFSPSVPLDEHPLIPNVLSDRDVMPGNGLSRLDGE